MQEFQLIHEKHVLAVDDNLIGTRPEYIARAKDLFRAIAKTNLRKEWIAQAAINFADDEELLALSLPDIHQIIHLPTLLPSGIILVESYRGKKYGPNTNQQPYE